MIPNKRNPWRDGNRANQSEETETMAKTKTTTNELELRKALERIELELRKAFNYLKSSKKRNWDERTATAAGEGWGNGFETAAQLGTEGDCEAAYAAAKKANPYRNGTAEAKYWIADWGHGWNAAQEEIARQQDA
jgi:hypothetical protein